MNAFTNKKASVSELSNEELTKVNGGRMAQLNPATEGVYLDGVLVQMSGSALASLFQNGTIRAVVVG